jgi:hypothetical protein
MVPARNEIRVESVPAGRLTDAIVFDATEQRAPSDAGLPEPRTW